MRSAPIPRVPSYRLHKASGQAIVTLAGQDVCLGQFGSDASRDRYDRAITEWLAGGRTNHRSAGDGITINELVLGYWQHAETYYQPTTLQGLKQALRGFRRLYGSQVALEIGPLALKAYRQKLVDSRLARATVNKYVGWIKSMIRWAVSEELLSAERLHAIQSLPALRAGRSQVREPEPVRPVARTSIEATLRYLSPTVADMVRVQLLTGMRPGELCAMTLTQINTRADPWLYQPATHKNAHHGKQRIIAIGPKARQILSERVQPSAIRAVFVVPSRRGARGPTTHRGYTVDLYRRSIHRACDAANVPRWSPNQLRHNAATLVREHFGLDAAGAVLGHSKLETTQVYAEREISLASRVALEIG